MGRIIKVTILDSGNLQIVPQSAFSGENNAVQLDCYCSDALKDYTKYIDFESNGVKYRSPAFTDGLANFVFNVPNIISNYNTKFQFIFISGETIIKTQIGNIYVQESVNAAEQITFESGDILDDFETRITLVEGKVDDFLTDFSIEVGSVDTLSPGTPAYVNKYGTNINTSFDFGIPQGEKGDQSFITEVANVTLTAASWTLVSGFYEYVYSNVLITANTLVNVIPSKSTNIIAQAADLLNYNEISVGSVKLFASYLPSGNIICNFNLYIKA